MPIGANCVPLFQHCVGDETRLVFQYAIQIKRIELILGMHQGRKSKARITGRMTANTDITRRCDMTLDLSILEAQDNPRYGARNIIIKKKK
jgi:hypothetical protein